MKRARRRRRAVGALAVGVLTLTLAAVVAPDALRVAGFSTPGSESQRASERLREALGYDPEPGMVVIASSKRRLDRPGGRGEVASVASQVGADPDVVNVRTPFGSDGREILLSRDRSSALILVQFREPGEQGAAAGIERIRDRVSSPELELRYGGFAVGFLDDNELIREDLLRAELISFPILALVLLLVFRGFAAAALPLAIGALSVLGTYAGLALLSNVVDLSIYALNLSTALGLGLAVNYGLFLVSRYREEVRGGLSPPEAVDRTMATAGRAVVFSACTVAAAAAALLFFPQQFIYSMGVGGVLTTALAAGAAVLVVPPLLSRVTIGDAERGEGQASAGSWYRFAQWVMRYPVAVALASAAILIAIGIPATKVIWTFLDKTALPPGLESREVADAIGTDFVPFLEFPISVAATERGTEVRRLGRRIAALPGAGYVSDAELAPDGTVALQVLARGPPYSRATQDLVKRMRALDPGLLVGGRAADYQDLRTSLVERAPVAALWLVALILIVVFLLTGSVVLAVKALLMNALTIFAVLGLLTVIFQDQALSVAAAIGYTGPAGLEITASVIVVAVTLGLATDYSILLLSRIKEAHDAGAPNRAAVALGLERSGRVITNAALIVIVANLALASGRVFIVQQIAVGLAIGVAIDATLVRACLVPALMRILGDRNWWAPAPLLRVRAWVDARLVRRLG